MAECWSIVVEAWLAPTELTSPLWTPLPAPVMTEPLCDAEVTSPLAVQAEPPSWMTLPPPTETVEPWSLPIAPWLALLCPPSAALSLLRMSPWPPPPAPTAALPPAFVWAPKAAPPDKPAAWALLWPTSAALSLLRMSPWPPPPAPTAALPPAFVWLAKAALSLLSKPTVPAPLAVVCALRVGPPGGLVSPAVVALLSAAPPVPARPLELPPPPPTAPAPLAAV